MYSEVRSMNPLLRNLKNERSQFIAENISQWQKQSKAQDCPSIIVACWQILLTDKAFFFQQPYHPVCVLVAGTERLFLVSVGKYCSVSQNVTHNELCKLLNKNGPPNNFAKRGSDHFVTWKYESDWYSHKSWALSDKYFFDELRLCGETDKSRLIAIIFADLVITINWRLSCQRLWALPNIHQKWK